MNKIAIVDKKNVLFNEEIKKIRANLKYSAINGDIKIIAITSSMPGEGKSVISANLAASFAQYDEKVLVIDCDLRKGRQKKIFSIPYNKNLGLSNLLINKNWKKEYKEYVKMTKYNNLFVIPTGPSPPNPSELLANSRFKELLEKLKDEFSIIILDCPPLSGLNDSIVISTYADATILVAKHKKTPIKALEESYKMLTNVGANVAGVIMNQVNAKENNYYYNNYYYGSYYKK